MRSDWRPGPHSWDPAGRDWRPARRFFLFGFLLFLGVVATMFGLFVWFVAGLISGELSRAFVVTLVVLVVVVVFFRSAVRTWWPVRGVVRMAESLAEGDYAVRTSVPRSGAMRPVVRSFNTMAERLETADEQRRRLLADLGHELRTPLTVVRGSIEAIADGVHEPDPDHLQALLDEVAVMERLLEDLRTLSLAEAGALGLHLEPTDLAALVGDAVSAHARTADDMGVVVRVIAAADVGEVTVDPVRIREVVSNLVVNALRAMPDGGALTVSVDRAADRFVRVAVADTGIGIESDEIDDVFERFHRGDRSGGTGLGLTISRDLVEAHGGTIAIESVVGGGTTVGFTLPLRRS